MEKTIDLNQEIKSFQKVWKQGYYEGDPEEVMSTCTYNVQGYLSVLHAVYLMCIKPYLSPELKVVEIGPGRGAWTKTFRDCKEVYALDALSAEHNAFWKYVGEDRKNFHYFQVEDFSCSVLPDDYFDFFFSFGTFCHISFDATTTYMQNIHKKMKSGSKGFLMVADYEKYNASMRNIDKLSVVRACGRLLFDKNPIRYKLLGFLIGMINKLYRPPIQLMDINESQENKAARWYHSGTKRTCTMLEEKGFHVISEDIGLLQRDPIIFFEKR